MLGFSPSIFLRSYLSWNLFKTSTLYVLKTSNLHVKICKPVDHSCNFLNVINNDFFRKGVSATPAETSVGHWGEGKQGFLVVRASLPYPWIAEEE